MGRVSLQGKFVFEERVFEAVLGTFMQLYDSILRLVKDPSAALNHSYCDSSAARLM